MTLVYRTEVVMLLYDGTAHKICAALNMIGRVTHRKMP